MARSSKATIARRIDEAAKLLSNGLGMAALRQVADLMCWNVGYRQLQRYFKEALRQIVESTKMQTRLEQFGLMIAQLDNLFARCVKEGKFQPAIHAMQFKSKLLQLEKALPMTEAKSESKTDERYNQMLLSLPPKEREEWIKFVEEEQHESIRQIRQDLLNEPEFINYLREKAIKESQSEKRRPGG